MTQERINELRALCRESMEGCSQASSYREPICVSPMELLELLETATVTEEA